MKHIILSQGLLLEVDDAKAFAALMDCYLKINPKAEKLALVPKLKQALGELQPVFKEFNLGILNEEEFLNKMKGKFPDLDIQQIIDSFNAMVKISEQNLQNIKTLAIQRRQNGYSFHLYSDSNPIHQRNIRGMLRSENMGELDLTVAFSFQCKLARLGLIENLIREIPPEEHAEITLVLGLPRKNMLDFRRQAVELENQMISKQLSTEYPKVKITYWNAEVEPKLEAALGLPMTAMVTTTTSTLAAATAAYRSSAAAAAIACSSAKIPASTPALTWSSQYVTKTNLWALAAGVGVVAGAGAVAAVRAYKKYGR